MQPSKSPPRPARSKEMAIVPVAADPIAIEIKQVGALSGMNAAEHSQVEVEIAASSAALQAAGMEVV